jgi:hypothetical protein
MEKVKDEIKRIIGNDKCTRIKYSKKGFIVPIYYGYDLNDKIIFDIESMRHELESILIDFESLN